MVAVNLLASLLTTTNLCISICLNIIACITVILYAITLVVFCRLSDMRSPLGGGGGGGGGGVTCFHVPLK